MKAVPSLVDEISRIHALNQYGILDTPPDAVLDSITQAASAICDTPIALITLVDSNRQWFKSKIGLEDTETSREVAFCAHAIANPDELLEVQDAMEDERFQHNPLVVDDPKIRFYAGKPLVTPEGHALGTLCVIDRKPKDLSDAQRQALNHLADTVMTFLEDRYRSPVSIISRAMEEHAPIAISIADMKTADSPIIFCNKGFETLTGYTKTEVIGKNCRFLQGRETDPKTVSAIRKSIADNVSATFLVKNYRKDGTQFWNELTLCPISNSAGDPTHYLGFQVDVTVRQTAEAALKNSHNQLVNMVDQRSAANRELQVEVRERRLTEEKYRRFIESAPYATVIINSSGVIQLVNAQFESMFDYLRDDIIGKPIEQLIPERLQQPSPPLSKDYFNGPLLRAAGNNRILRGVTSGGREFPVEISLSAIEETNAQLVTAAIRDISERQKMEAQNLKLQNELAHIGRINTMGQLSAGLAHELNQPLTAISQYSDAALSTMMSKSTVDTEILDLMKCIDEETQRAGNIIRAVRQFIRKDAVTMGKIRLNELLSQTIQLVGPNARVNNVDVELKAGTIPELFADRVQIAQVLVNLLRNSVDAMAAANSATRHIVVSTEFKHNLATVVVDDTGPGLDPNIEIFSPFETRKSDGLGLGLSISRSIVEAHGGQLWADNNMSDGARFLFTIPVKEN